MAGTGLVSEDRHRWRCGGSSGRGTERGSGGGRPPFRTLPERGRDMLLSSPCPRSPALPEQEMEEDRHPERQAPRDGIAQNTRAPGPGAAASGPPAVCFPGVWASGKLPG